jgi:hypothetical protein
MTKVSALGLGARRTGCGPKKLKGEYKMKVSWKKAAGAALVAVIAFGAIAARLQATQAAAGRFKLPFDAQWGNVALPTGDYTFTVDHITANGTIIVYRGTQAVGVFRSQLVDSNENQGKSGALLCIRHDGKVTVRALRLPEGSTFYFSLPKDLSVMASKQPQLIETVSVQVGGE